jgi:polyisoprenyl-phosphate glycosyltransferase
MVDLALGESLRNVLTNHLVVPFESDLNHTSILMPSDSPGFISDNRSREVKPSPLSSNYRPADGLVLTLIVPLFNEQEIFPALAGRLDALVEAVEGKYGIEIILIDDGSRDRTWDLISQYAAANGRVRGISFSRNFGHQRALFCGYELASGDAVISMDGDLQDPPELIEQMLEKWKDGFDIVFGVRRLRFGETSLKRWTAHWFYRLLNWIAEVDTPLDCGDFRLISRTALEALLRMGDKQKYLRGMVGWIGFRSCQVEYDRPARLKGQTKFSLLRMVQFAFEGITSFSNLPLRVAFLLSILAPLPFLLYLAYSLFLHLFTRAPLVPGWTSLLLCLVLFGSLNLIAIGIVGEYLAKIFEAIKNRPDYIIAKQTESSSVDARVR